MGNGGLYYTADVIVAGASQAANELCYPTLFTIHYHLFAATAGRRRYIGNPCREADVAMASPPLRDGGTPPLHQ